MAVIKHLKRLSFLGGLTLAVLFGILYNATQTQPKDSVASPPKTSETQHPTENLRFSPTQTSAVMELQHFQTSEFYRVIIDNNLFRPLGWRPPRSREPYRLLGTILPTDRKHKAQAIVQNTVTKENHTARIGETLDTDTTLVDIQPKQVTLETSGAQRKLTLNTTPLLK